MFHIDTFGTQCRDPRRIYRHQRNPANYACVSDPQKLYLTIMCEATDFKVLLESKRYPRHELPNCSDTTRCRRMQDLNHFRILSFRKDSVGMKNTKENNFTNGFPARVKRDSTRKTYSFTIYFLCAISSQHLSLSSQQNSITKYLKRRDLNQRLDLTKRK